MPRTGQLVAGHVLHTAISADGLTEVWRATNVKTTEQRAIRILRPEAASHRRALHDLLVAQRRLEHPNRLELVEVTEVDGRLAVVTEWVNGPSLHTWSRIRPREIDEVLRVFAEIVDGVGVAHRAGLVHGALDPRRVWMRPANGGFFPKVDFAVGEIASDLQLSPLRAPEQITGDRIDARTDLYLLGAMVYEIAARHGPFEPGQTDAMPLARLRPDAPPGIVHLVSALLEPDPDRRPSSIDEVQDELMGAIRGDPPVERNGTAPTGARRISRPPTRSDALAWTRHQMTLAAVAALAGSVGTALWLAYH